MKVLLTVVLILGLGLVSSCTPPAGIVVEASKLYIDDPDAPTVTVMRRRQLAGAAVTYEIALDAEVIAYLGTGDRIEFQVQPGEHYIAMAFRGGPFGVNTEEVIRFDAIAKEKYYFYCKVDVIGGSEEFFIQLTPEQGKRKLAEKKFELLTVKNRLK